MFLDPDPRQGRERTRNSSGTGFFASQRPIHNPRDSYGNRYARRKPLEERSRSENNRQASELVASSPSKPTVRVVRSSPTFVPEENEHEFEKPKPTADEIASDSAEDEHVHSHNSVHPRLPESAVAKPANVRDPGFPGSEAAAQDTSVSHATRSTNETQDPGTVSSNALFVSRIHASANWSWHCRSGSSGNFSTSSTLKEGQSSIFGGQSVGSRSRLSQGTTLRGTPTPYEQEHRERAEAGESARPDPVQALHTLEEASAERSTVRVVSASLRSESSHSRFDSATRPSSAGDRPPALRPTDCESIRESSANPVSRRTSSTDSLPTAANLGSTSVIQYPCSRQSQDSLAESRPSSTPTASSPNFVVVPSERSILPSSRPPSSRPPSSRPPSSRPPSSRPPSSPNFITYHSDASRPRSRSHPLQHATSYDSIASRLELHSRSGTSFATSPGPSSSTDTLPPLQVPKKRLRHKPASLSLSSASNEASARGDRMVTEEEIDALPYPRHQFSSHLSTIASESERNSRRSSQPFSHFSIGSGVLTGDDSSSIPLSGHWSTSRRGSAPIESLVPSSPTLEASHVGEPGDMTLGIFREESAKPQPLFKRSGSVPGLEDRKYDGPLPPLPPVPPSRESDENFDTVSELHTPRLKEQRSGYSLRTRSNSTPSHSRSRRSNSHSRHLSQASYVESERGSHGSSIFPLWAKQFYMHNVPLVSASKISLGGHNPPGPGQSHLRNDSSWTERSITSRLGTGYSEIETSSPTSSHFLPSIFRPRTRGRSNTGGKKLRKSRARPSQDDGSRPDSMAIGQDPLPHGEPGETTASGQPKYGELKDSAEQRPPLPRKYSKQKQWNEMTFPRPMTKDRLSDFRMNIGEPRLGPSKRVSNRLSIWRAPSFVESLDTLVRSRANRQILLFALGFVLPLCWMVAAVLPIPKRPISASELEKSLGGSEDDVAAAMMKHEAGDAEKRWREEKLYLKARWWRSLNRIMSVVGVLVIGAVIALAVVATTR